MRVSTPLPPPPLHCRLQGRRGPWREAGRPLASPRPRLREADTAPRPPRPGESGVRACRGLPSLPSSARRVFHCSPSLCPLGGQGNCRLLVPRHGMTMISAPPGVGPALIGTEEKRKERFCFLLPPQHQPSWENSRGSLEAGFGRQCCVALFLCASPCCSVALF